jgi:hypothetical protein
MPRQESTEFEIESSHERRNYFAVLSVRPKVAELSFQLFGRALHPEVFEVH